MTDSVALKKALFSIKKLKQMLEEKKPTTCQSIAIVGIGCRFPQALSKDEYWQLMCQGKNIISKIPEERWKLLSGTEEVELRDNTHPYWGGYMSNINMFDAYFFGISPREAARMDPQQRLLLEVCYEALEDGGMPIEKLAGSNMGVFASLYVSQLAHMQRIESDLDALYLPTGNVLNMAANRISYLLDLHGPSLVVDTACSSSMVALHLACLNIQNNLCDSAIVCGARLNLLPYINYVLSKSKMLSPDGQCKTFDASANGYALGEGIGAIILKPLDKAIADNDRIYAVIAGSSVNQDGKTNGLTAPNGLQQEALLKAAYKIAQVDPKEISYIECHGTGTFLGDPIEVQALGETLSKNRGKENPCWISSVKTNIGHLEHAAGIASIIKVALALKQAKIPPHLNLNTLNPHIPFDKYHFQIPKNIEPMPKYGRHRVAGVSGFGFGGTSAHVVMRDLSEQESLPLQLTVSENKTGLFTLSAKDPTALKIYIENWLQFLEKNPSLNLEQLCYCMHLRRSHYSHRLAITAQTTTELYNSLASLRQTNLETLENSEKILIGMNKKIKTVDLKNIALSYVNGMTIDWVKYEENRIFSHLDLPLYPWQHKNYWPPLSRQSIKENDNQIDPYPMQGKKITSPLNTIQFEFKVDTKHLPDLQDTRHILHVGYYLEILAYTMDNLFRKSSFTVTEMSFISPIIVPNDAEITVQLTLEKIGNDSFSFHFFSQSKNQKNWILHAKGDVQPSIQSTKKSIVTEQVKLRCNLNESGYDLYQQVNAIGIPVGGSTRWVKHYWLGQNEMLCEFHQPMFSESNDKFKLKIHPSVFDSVLHPLFMFLPKSLARPYIASHIGKMTYHGIKNKPLHWFGILKNPQSINEHLLSDYSLLSENNEIIIECEDVRLTPLTSKIDVEKIANFKEQAALDLTSLSLQGRRNQVINFLIDRAADIFSMPKEDIGINQTLTDLGIDSLMALILIKDIETGLGESFSMQTILQGPSINDLTDVILKQPQESKHDIIAPANESEDNRWIAYRKPQANAKIRLFCFPFGGGGASTYFNWQNTLPDFIEVCPIQFPGRETRIDELGINQMSTLVEKLFEGIKSELTLPYAFIGHSFGSLVAFELTRYLRDNNLPMPIHLYISAFHDPKISTRSLNNLLLQLKESNLDLFNNKDISNDQLNQLCEIFIKNGIMGYQSEKITNEVLRNLLPSFITDISIMKNYRYQDELPLDLPITLFVGKQDTWVTYEEHLGWANHTKNKIKLHEFDSGHFFIKEDIIRKQILAIMEDGLAIPVVPAKAET